MRMLPAFVIGIAVGAAACAPIVYSLSTAEPATETVCDKTQCRTVTEREALDFIIACDSKPSSATVIEARGEIICVEGLK